jgi:hypothetical protein
LRILESSYTGAKAVDLTWDIVVGRAGQLLVALIVYRVFRRAAVVSMKAHPVAFESFLSMQFIDATVTASAIATYARDIGQRKGSELSGRHVTVGISLVFCASYALAFATWISAMTGYQVVAAPVTQTSDRSYINVTDLPPCDYIIVDGQRIDFWPNYCVTVGSSIENALSQCKLMLDSKKIGISGADLKPL